MCLRELLGALQTLCWDKQCVKGALLILSGHNLVQVHHNTVRFVCLYRSVAGRYHITFDRLHSGTTFYCNALTALRCVYSFHILIPVCNFSFYKQVTTVPVYWLSEFKSQASDHEVSILALATLANILAFSDTILLTDTVIIESLGAGIPVLMESLRTSQQRPERFYAAAAVANASAHPRLADILKSNGGAYVHTRLISEYC